MFLAWSVPGSSAWPGENVAAPLVATQILWINLLTDTGPALAMGVDPPPDDVMDRPPRRITDRVIDPEMVRGIGFIWPGDGTCDAAHARPSPTRKLDPRSVGHR